MFLMATPIVMAAGPQDAVLAALEAQAKVADPGFAGFSAESGKALFATTHSGGKPDSPSCTTCHTDSPLNTGKTRAGRPSTPWRSPPIRNASPTWKKSRSGSAAIAIVWAAQIATGKGYVATWLIAE